MTNPPIKNQTFDWILGVIFGALLSITLVQYTNLVSSNFISEARNIASASMVINFVFVLGLLFFNKRLSITIGGWILTATLFVLLITNQGSFAVFTTARNMIYLLLIPYLIAHVLIHGIFWLYKRQRKVFTKYGIVNLVLIIILITYSYGIVNLFK